MNDTRWHQGGAKISPKIAVESKKNRRFLVSPSLNKIPKVATIPLPKCAWPPWFFSIHFLQKGGVRGVKLLVEAIVPILAIPISMCPDGVWRSARLGSSWRSWNWFLVTSNKFHTCYQHLRKPSIFMSWHLSWKWLEMHWFLADSVVEWNCLKSCWRVQPGPNERKHRKIGF